MQKKIWTSTISPCVWQSFAGNSVKIKNLTKLQIAGPGIITGALKSTLVLSMEIMTDPRNPENRKKISRVFAYVAKFKRLENHPVHKRMSQSTKCRLSRTSFLRDACRLGKQDTELLEHVHGKITSHCSLPALKRELFP